MAGIRPSLARPESVHCRFSIAFFAARNPDLLLVGWWSSTSAEAAHAAPRRRSIAGCLGLLHGRNGGDELSGADSTPSGSKRGSEPFARPRDGRALPQLLPPPAPFKISVLAGVATSRGALCLASGIGRGSDTCEAAGRPIRR